MKLVTLAAAAAFALTGSCAMAEDNAALMKPIDGFIKATSQGRLAEAAGYFGPSQFIIDEFAPYHWSGPSAVKTWWAGFVADSKTSGMTDAVMTLGAPTRVLQTARHAYVVAPAVLTYKIRATPGRETGVFTFSLDKTGKGWRLAAMSWAGDKPVP